MAGDFWEQAVEKYFQADRGVFLHWQYVIGGDADKWKAEPDFLAINFRDNQIWMVEVTAAANPKKVFGKIPEFVEEYIPRICTQLTAERVVRDDFSRWDIGIWMFGLDTVRREFERLAQEVGAIHCFTDLRSAVFFDWDEIAEIGAHASSVRRSSPGAKSYD